MLPFFEIFKLESINYFLSEDCFAFPSSFFSALFSAVADFGCLDSQNSDSSVPSDSIAFDNDGKPFILPKKQKEEKTIRFLLRLLNKVIIHIKQR